MMQRTDRDDRNSSSEKRAGEISARALKTAYRKRQKKKSYQAAYQTGRRRRQRKSFLFGAERSIGGRSFLRRSAVKNKRWLIIFAVTAALIFFLLSSMMSCSVALQSALSNAVAVTFTAEDADILGTDEDYRKLEEELRQNIAQTESSYPGYDEYRYDTDEINHNPYELASYLTVLYEDYKREEAQVQETLKELFSEQYRLTRTSFSEGEKRILVTKLENRGLGYVISQAEMTEEQRQRYSALLYTCGNRPDLFEDDIYASYDSSGSDYRVPSEALSDEKFAAVLKEAEKYLGYPYVWGGSNPSTSFDCSGYVCWVLNQSGFYSVGRTTAQGLYNQCAKISADEAKPGDLVFFTGTYQASHPVTHVGIYVGNGMMINAGNPIKYANVYSSYWKPHFYAFGRLPQSN